ncbi:hypothetical protein RCL1_003456 [Eukaryota sp. TZLM3-RCL]
MVRAGRVELCSGPVFSGKTSWLLDRLSKFSKDGLRCEIISYEKDASALQKVSLSSHKGTTYGSLTCSSLFGLSGKFQHADVVAIDNSHFFSSVADFADSLAEQGKIVLITSLNSAHDFTTFPSFTELLPRVDVFTLISNAKCSCGSPGSFSRFHHKNNIPSESIYPGAEHYDTSCRKCHPLGGNGRLVLYVGPMFAGKTTSMINHCRKMKASGRKTVVIKFAADTRYSSSDTLVTHDGDSIKAVAVSRLSDAANYISDAEVIGIDEGQFYEDVDLASEWASSGKIVLVSGLSGTFQRKAFSGFMDLVGKSDEVYLLHSRCKCGFSAPYSKRLVQSSALQLIGGAESYAPVCRSCYYS